MRNHGLSILSFVKRRSVANDHRSGRQSWYQIVPEPEVEHVGVDVCRCQADRQYCPSQHYANDIDPAPGVPVMVAKTAFSAW